MMTLTESVLFVKIYIENIQIKQGVGGGCLVDERLVLYKELYHSVRCVDIGKKDARHEAQMDFSMFIQVAE